MLEKRYSSSVVQKKCELKDYLNNSVKQASRKLVFDVSAFSPKCGAVEIRASESNDDYLRKHVQLCSLFSYDDEVSNGGLGINPLRFKGETEERLF